MTYGTGQVIGTVVQDDVVIGGITLSQHTFGVADQESSNFATTATPFDGLMGLAKSVCIRFPYFIIRRLT